MKKMMTKKGATSFYIVAFSTLILVIIAASFTTVILSEMARTANEDLSQSAYDSALAGIEDAKLAFYNYQKCIEMGSLNNGTINCEDILRWADDGDCTMVAKIIGRLPKDNDGGEVIVQESSNGNNSMQQAYTCVKFKTKLFDYITSLDGSKPKVIRVRLGKNSEDEQIKAEEINNVVISWYSKNDSSGGFNFGNVGGNDKVLFPKFGALVTPPMLSVGLIQTADTFSLDDFKEVDEDNMRTNRGTLFLVPTGGNNSLLVRTKDDAYENDMYGNYISAYTQNGGTNEISKELFVKSNDHKVKNLPIAVHCDASVTNNSYACSASFELPDAIGGGRNDDTFTFVVSTPYGQGKTDVDLKFISKNDSIQSENGEIEHTPVSLEGMQISIDSTGRANDLYRRVEARLDLESPSLPYPIYGITLLGGKENRGLLQKLWVPTTCEYDFEPITCFKD